MKDGIDGGQNEWPLAQQRHQLVETVHGGRCSLHHQMQASFLIHRQRFYMFSRLWREVVGNHLHLLSATIFEDGQQPVYHRFAQQRHQRLGLSDSFLGKPRSLASREDSKFETLLSSIVIIRTYMK